MSSTPAPRICVNAPYCANEVSPKSRFADCPTCRASIGGWVRRKAHDILKRRTRLSKYTARMTEVLDRKGLKFKPTHDKL